MSAKDAEDMVKIGESSGLYTNCLVDDMDEDVVSQEDDKPPSDYGVPPGVPSDEVVDAYLFQLPLAGDDTGDSDIKETKTSEDLVPEPVAKRRCLGEVKQPDRNLYRELLSIKWALPPTGAERASASSEL